MDNLKWKAAESPKKKAVKDLCEETGLTYMVAQILVQRGVSTLVEAENFMRPKLEDLHDPETMLNMEKAVKRIEKAINRGERIMVYGDYDVDGTTSVAMVSTFLEGLNVQIVPYICLLYTSPSPRDS